MAGCVLPRSFPGAWPKLLVSLDLPVFRARSSRNGPGHTHLLESWPRLPKPLSPGFRAILYGRASVLSQILLALPAIRVRGTPGGGPCGSQKGPCAACYRRDSRPHRARVSGLFPKNLSLRLRRDSAPERPRWPHASMLPLPCRAGGPRPPALRAPLSVGYRPTGGRQALK